VKRGSASWWAALMVHAMTRAGVHDSIARSVADVSPTTGAKFLADSEQREADSARYARDLAILTEAIEAIRERAR
jgi:hypothetical protein